MNAEWQKAVCRTAGLLRQTEDVLLPGLVGYVNYLSQNERRFSKWFDTMSASRNPAILFVATTSSLSIVEVIGHNRVNPVNEYQCRRLSKVLLVLPWCGAISDVAPRVQQIHELVHARDGLAPSTIPKLRISDCYLNSQPHADWNIFEG